MPALELTGLSKSFGPNRVVSSFSLDVEKGAFVSLLGPSGCGKTTVLRMVAGFEHPDHGQVMIGGRDVTHRKASERNIGMVFQAYALFPNLTVAGNIGFGLRVKGVPANGIRARVDEMLALIGLEDKADRYPHQLSGGQQQRVALARALAPRPDVLLLDEPLSALDAKIRVSLRNEMRAIQRRLGITTIFVTHDQEEALSMSDLVVVMNGGAAEQIDTPQNIYRHPRTAFVAQFVGSLNMLTAEVVDAARRGVSVNGRRFTAPQGLALPAASPRFKFGLRPEALLAAPLPKGAVALPARLTDVTFMGAVARVSADVEGQVLTIDMFSTQAASLPARGEALTVGFRPQDMVALQ